MVNLKSKPPLPIQTNPPASINVVTDLKNGGEKTGLGRPRGSSFGGSRPPGPAPTSGSDAPYPPGPPGRGGTPVSQGVPPEGGG